MIREIRKSIEARPLPDPLTAEMKPVSHQLASSRTARGIALARQKGSPELGFFLALPGNAQTARELIGALEPASVAGFEVVAFDYPNLVGQAALPRLHELVADVNALVSIYLLNEKYKGKASILYGVSTGGLLLAQTLRNQFPGTLTLVLDSVPDRIPKFLWCDSELNPSDAVASMKPPKNALLVVNGASDPKVLPANSRALAEAAERNSGCHIVIQGAIHPFESGDNAGRRMENILSYAKTKECKSK